MVGVHQESLTRSYPATPDTVRLVRGAVGDYAEAAGMTDEEFYGLRLAVSEAVTNVVQHAYRGRRGNVHVTARAVDGELWVLIADDGRGCQTPPDTPGLGWGLALITDACEEFTLVERAQGGTEARMRFRLGAGRPGGHQLRGSVASAN